MKKIFKIFLWGIGSFIGLMLLGFIASVIFAPKTTPVPSKVEVSLKSIVGNWYVVCSNSNPKYRNKIAIDYIIFAFREDGAVVKTTNSKVEKGTYTFDEEKKVFIVKLDKGEAGMQATYWRQESDGKARIFYWKNLTLGYEREKDELYVKENSTEWARRGKVTLNR